MTQLPAKRSELFTGLEQIIDYKKNHDLDIYRTSSEYIDIANHFGSEHPEFVIDMIYLIRTEKFTAEMSKKTFNEFREKTNNEPRKIFESLIKVSRITPPNSHEEFEVVSLISRLEDPGHQFKDLLLENLLNFPPDENRDEKLTREWGFYLAKIGFLLELQLPKEEKKYLIQKIIDSQGSEALKDKILVMTEKFLNPAPESDE